MEKTKKCVNCIRQLPLHCFSTNPSRSDGYSEGCRDCNRYHRKLSYRSKLPEDAEIHQRRPLTVYPFNEHTKRLLNEMRTFRTHKIRATHLPTAQLRVVEVAHHTHSIDFNVYNVDDPDDPKTYRLVSGFKVLGDDFDEFLEIAVPRLRSLETRIHLSAELDI